ncbi:serine protease inhibitor [Symbiobacterium terraclitae]|uniref:Serine protease inhibitor n=1 Tax=Symbiobacterium terraclitae TaxID=557451 RepID=A0ABS4JN50_9FIRM|nr:serine protease inhibitor [Symbiobacterium terraclitae]
MVVLASALYFRGAWSEAFDPKLTRGGTFTTAAGARRTLLFMERDGEGEKLTNRPFLVAIRDDETGALLFLSAVRDPGRSGR